MLILVNVHRIKPHQRYDQGFASRVPNEVKKKTHYKNHATIVETSNVSYKHHRQRMVRRNTWVKDQSTDLLLNCRTRADRSERRSGS